ncbi:hypothetical protein A6R68_17949, partial [Neotoma lepida]
FVAQPNCQQLLASRWYDEFPGWRRRHWAVKMDYGSLKTNSHQTGFIWGEIKQMWDGGLQDYIHDWWNLMDFVMNSLYLATISLKIVAFVK